MGAPIKINKDLLVITPNYTKKWLAEGQPKVSGLHSQVALPFAPCALPAWACQKKARIFEWKIKRRDCPSAPRPLGSSIPELETKESPAQGCLILPLSIQDPTKEVHFPLNITPQTCTDCANYPCASVTQMYKMWWWQLWRISRCPFPWSPCWAAVQFLHSDKGTPLWRDLYSATLFVWFNAALRVRRRKMI